MRGANNVRTVLRQETIGLPVHRVAEMSAGVVVGKYLVPLPYDKTLERPVAIADTEFAGTRIRELDEVTNSYFLLSHVWNSLVGLLPLHARSRVQP